MCAAGLEFATWLSQISSFEIGSLVAAFPDTWHFRVWAGTGLQGLNGQLITEISKV